MAMEGLQTYPIILFIFITLITASLAQIGELVSCLNSNGVNNFTLHSQSKYGSLVNDTIQNLRFAQPASPKPVAIVLPNTKGQLKSSISCCRQHGPFVIRIRSGGHSYEGLSSVAEQTPFVIVDLMNLNRVIVDTSSSTAWVEAGATLGETYYEIANKTDSHGFSAGSCPTVGTGGHIGGGGFGLLSRKYGLAADNVVDAILVDAEGRLLDRKSMGEDVFWAIRGGGGGSWGAVYAWRIKLLQVPKTVTVFSVSRTGESREVAELVQKWQLVAPELDDELYLSVAISADSTVSTEFAALYLGPKASMLSILNRVFPELNITGQDCQEMTWIESVVFFSGVSTIADLKDRVHHGKSFFKAKSDYIRDPIPLHGIESLMKILKQEPNGYVIFDPYGGMMGRIANDSIPFPHREGNLYSIQYMVSWGGEDESREKQFINWIQNLYEFMEPYASKNPRAAYVNYIDLHLGENGRDWAEKYFIGNYKRLVHAKMAIDPENVFNHPQSIRPRLRKRKI